MAAQRFHIGKNGPAPCKARKIACRFGEERHGSESHVTAIWEAEQELEHGDFLGGASRSAEDSSEDYAVLAMLSDRANYISEDLDGDGYSEEEVNRAIDLATDSLSDLARVPVLHRDMGWFPGSSTSVQRYMLEDGTIGYFKGFVENSRDSEYEFQSFGTSTLGAAVNEVNAHRMAKLFGPGYEDLVPETVIREVEGELGSFQREVKEDPKISRNFHGSEELREDYRNAAIFDFVIGNMDRHDANYIIGVVANRDGTRSNRLRLIDNAYSFPDLSGEAVVNDSCFADNEGTDPDSEPVEDGDLEFEGYRMEPEELELTDYEIDNLTEVRDGVYGWIDRGTIEPDRGKATIDRINELIYSGTMSKLRDHLDRLNRAARLRSE